MNTGTSPNNDTSNPSSFTLVQVINTGQPVTIRPSVAVDSAGRRTIFFGTGRSYTTNDNSGTSDQGTQQQDIYGVTDNTLLTTLPAVCQTLPTLATLFNASSTVVNNDQTVTGSGITTATTLPSLETSLMATVGGTGTNASCYKYSGWMLPLAQGNASNSTVVTTGGTTITAQQPSERVVSSQTLFSGILLTPTYVPANLAQITASGSSACDPIPVPGTSNLYGLDYLTGTASTALANSFGVVGTVVSKSLSLGSGMASSPVLHVGGNNVSGAFGISGGTVLQSIGTLGPASNGEISWREPVNNQ
jgi:type IV pilus assembly protein PilY1